MGVYDRQAATALRQIKAKGSACLWRASNVVVPRAGLTWDATDTAPTDYPVSILFLPDTRQNRAYIQSMADTDITVGKDYGLMPAYDFTPTEKATVYSADGNEHLRTIYEAHPFAPNGQVILWTLYFNVVEVPA